MPGDDLSNQRATFRAFAGRPGGAFHEDGGISWYATTIPSAAFNRAFCDAASLHRLDGLAATTRAVAADRGRPMGLFVGPFATPRDLPPPDGFVVAGRLPAMCVDVADARVPEADDGVTVDRIDTPPAFDRWIDVLVEGFDLTDDLAAPLRRLFTGFDADHARRCPGFVARAGGRDLAAAYLSDAAGAATVYCVTTVPAARRRGLGALVTAAAMREAAARGHTRIRLQATPMGFDLYRRMGFAVEGWYETFESA